MSHTVTNGDQSTSTVSYHGVTYSNLGIITGKPKRPEFSLKSERLKSFSNSVFARRHPLFSPKFAEAGFFYAGPGDCARCFFCGGGLRNWHDDDNVWVEHARWFPNCCFIRLKMGQDFVDTVQKLFHRVVKISIESVLIEMTKRGLNTIPIEFRDDLLERNPAVMSVIDFGYLKDDVEAMARNLKASGETLSSITLLLEAKRCGKQKSNLESRFETRDNDFNIDSESLEDSPEINMYLRQRVMCRVCKEKDISIVFLPCGHFVCCVDCSLILAGCPCGLDIKGLVRAFLPP